MKIQIWSDVVCPFCYIGKRRFEKALEQFAHKDEVKIQWMSYQLDPQMKPVPGQTIDEHLSQKKGGSLQQAKAANAHVTTMANAEGLTYNFEKVIPANTYDAHRLIHLASKHGLQHQAEERLFSAYFIEGLNIANHDTLREIGLSIGLPQEELNDLFSSDIFGAEVHEDIDLAATLGVNGVPFFVFEEKYAVSGAQSSSVFLNVLTKVWDETSQANKLASVNGEGAT